jgi:hypothetical protein
MKTNLLHISIAAVLAAGAVYAQSSISLNANVPFDFVAGEKTLPAGHYTVAQAPALGVLMIRSSETKGAVFAMTNPVYSPAGRNESKLVFHRYGNAYFLSEVWGSENAGGQLPASKEDRKLEAGLTPSTNTIVASLR